MSLEDEEIPRKQRMWLTASYLAIVWFRTQDDCAPKLSPQSLLAFNRSESLEVLEDGELMPLSISRRRPKPLAGLVVCPGSFQQWHVASGCTHSKLYVPKAPPSRMRDTSWPQLAFDPVRALPLRAAHCAGFHKFIRLMPCPRIWVSSARYIRVCTTVFHRVSCTSGEESQQRPALSPWRFDGCHSLQHRAAMRSHQ